MGGRGGLITRPMHEPGPVARWRVVVAGRSPVAYGTGGSARLAARARRASGQLAHVEHYGTCHAHSAGRWHPCPSPLELLEHAARGGSGVHIQWPEDRWGTRLEHRPDDD